MEINVTTDATIAAGTTVEPRIETGPRPQPGEITRLLHSWRKGSGAAEGRLWEILYDEMKSLARGVLHRHGQSRSKNATSLVHKAYLRLLGTDLDWNDRQHFFAVAARAMRFVLVDEARRLMARKRGNGETTALDHQLFNVTDSLVRRPEEVLAVHQALARLGERHARHEKLVELRYFAGLSVAETAQILGVTTRTIVRDWKSVRVWLHGELNASGAAASS